MYRYTLQEAIIIINNNSVIQKSDKIKSEIPLSPHLIKWENK